MPINSGWANNCGIELFTYGWVQCDVTIPKKHIPPSVSGSGSARNKVHTAKPILQLFQPLPDSKFEAIIEQEDEEILAIVSLLISSGIIK